MALSPMMQQYLQIHDNYPDCLLLFRLGDFYELFFEDAKTASRELELTLTGKDCGLEERAPMCGVPFHSVNTYIEKLIEAGLDGIEASYTYYKTSYSGKLTKQEIYDDIREYYGDRLFISGGSDYHADGKKGVKNPREIGDCGITLEEFLANDRLVAMLPHRPE